MSLKNVALLPNGLKDLLQPEAEKEAHVINILMNEFSKFDYGRVKPPLVEFEETLLIDGPGKALASQTFRLMDPLSRQMMGVRADTTAQIARIAQSRLADEARPLRVSYAADILRVNGTQLRPERQFCQVGCEMIGVNDCRDDVEICLVALSSLHQLKIQNMSIDLSLPVLVNEIYKSYDVPQDRQDTYNKYLQKRDRDGLLEQKSEVSDVLVELLDASGIASDAVKKLKNIKVDVAVKAAISNLIDVYEMLSDALKVYNLTDVNITIDLVERRGFEYKSGVSFTLFSPKARGEIGRGGRDYICNKQEAVGFSLYMDGVLEAVEIDQNQKTQQVELNTSWTEIKKLQDEGFQVSRTKKTK